MGGCVCCEDLANPTPILSVIISSDFFLELEEEIEEDYFKLKNIEELKQKEMFHTFNISVIPEARGKGIAQALLYHTWEYARRLGFKQVMGLLTNIKS